MLDELLSRIDAARPPRISRLRLEDVLPNPNQPRKYFDKESLGALSDSIKAHGVIQPITVRRAGAQYEIIAGERRYRAAYIAGLEEIPAIIISADDDKSAVLALIENIQRESLGFFEAAESYRNLIARFGFTQDELARELGISRSAVSNKLRLLKLPTRVRKLIRDYGMTERHARALLSLDGEDAQVEAAMRIGADGLNARQAESLIRGMTRPKPHADDRQSRLPDVKCAIKRVVDSIKKTGMDAQMSRTESEDRIEYVITVRK